MSEDPGNPALDDTSAVPIEVSSQAAPRAGSSAGLLPPASLPTPAPALCIAGRYDVLGLIGVGGMGSVYRVHDTELGVVVALKLLRPSAGDVSEFQAQFRREATLARKVSHVNVARTFDVGEHQGERFITMEFIEGESLASMLERSGAMAVARVIEIALQICAGLGAAHAAGVVHLDLKPDNVLVDRSGRVVITDFGIARAVEPGRSSAAQVIAGTAAYMSPEQVEAKPTDARADLYALGAVLYELLTGARAWSGVSFFGVASRRLVEPPPDPRALRPEIPDTIGVIVQTCMARSPEHRYPGVEALSQALGAAPGAPGVRRGAARDPEPQGTPQPRLSATRIAILPFRNGGAREDDFLADELTDELIDGLSMLGTLRVRPRRAVQGADASDLSALGKALDVDVIVEGTLRRSSETVRISARVLTVADALQVWARRFDHAAGDLVGANRAVLDALTEALSTGPARPAPPPPQPASSAMFSELYLRARRELRTSWDGIGDISLAVELFRQALLRSPDDPAALSGFAMARSRRYNYDGGNDEKLTEIRAVAERAVALAPHMGEPLLTLASLDYVTSEWPRAVRALRGALRLAPGLLKAHETLGYIEVEVGRLREGGLRLQNVHALDPAQPLVRHELARVGAFQGEWERVYELLSVASGGDTRDQTYVVGCARIDLWSGQPRFDVVAAEDAAGKPALLLARAMGEAARGRPLAQDVEQFFLGMISRTGPRSRFRPLLWQVMTEIHASVGETSRAVHTARQAVAAHLFDRSWMTLCPALRSLRSLPEWHTLLAQVDAHTQPIRDALDEPMS